MRETSKEKSNGSKRTEGSVDHRSQQDRNLKYGLRSLYRFEGLKDSSPHLENCTGRDKTKTANDLFQPVLGDRLFAKNWHWFVFPKGSMSIDQANKSAGWMPGH